MSKQIAARTREKWVDDVKIIACILVVVGHFFQSMVKASILPDSGLYEWFITTVYYFHVPLFFICSGYLYQKYSKVNSVGSWRRNVAKKVLALGIPYVTFSTATWVLKKAFSSSVNNQIGGLGDTLLFHPASPYWYLYALFFIFLLKALFTKHPYSMYELKICRDYRDGKVTKEELDKCSTCDMNCVINNGLSEASNGKAYFGEMTFFDGSGFDEFHPEEWDKKFGDMIKLPNVE